MSKQTRAIFGDFQTPIELAREVVELVLASDASFAAVVEPTCGVGSFLLATSERLGAAASYFGFELNPRYVRTCQEAVRNAGMEAQIQPQDFYEMDWKTFLASFQPGFWLSAIHRG